VFVAGALSRTPLGELTALSQAFYLDLKGVFVAGRGGERRVETEGREMKGTKGGVGLLPPYKTCCGRP